MRCEFLREGPLVCRTRSHSELLICVGGSGSSSPSLLFASNDSSFEIKHADDLGYGAGRSIELCRTWTYEFWRDLLRFTIQTVVSLDDQV